MYPVIIALFLTAPSEKKQQPNLLYTSRGRSARSRTFCYHHDWISGNILYSKHKGGDGGAFYFIKKNRDGFILYNLKFCIHEINYWLYYMDCMVVRAAISCWFFWVRFIKHVSWCTIIEITWNHGRPVYSVEAIISPSIGEAIISPSIGTLLIVLISPSKRQKRI